MGMAEEMRNGDGRVGKYVWRGMGERESMYGGGCRMGEMRKGEERESCDELWCAVMVVVRV